MKTRTPVYYDDGTVYLDGPLSAHEILRAQQLTQRLRDAVAGRTGSAFRQENELLTMLPRWLSSHAEYPHARQRLRENLANPPHILGDAA